MLLIALTLARCSFDARGDASAGLDAARIDPSSLLDNWFLVAWTPDPSTMLIACSRAHSMLRHLDAWVDACCRSQQPRRSFPAKCCAASPFQPNAEPLFASLRLARQSSQMLCRFAPLARPPVPLLAKRAYLPIPRD
jgi:hypothetical protein